MEAPRKLGLALITAFLAGLSICPGATADEVEAPKGEALAYDANASRTNVANEPAVFGPLRQAWTTYFSQPTSQPLVAEGKVLVNVPNDSSDYGSRIVALSAQTGDTPGGYYTAPIAAGEGVVASVNEEGDVRTFSLADGEPLWERPARPGEVLGGGSVMIDRGVVYVGSDNLNLGGIVLSAYNAQTGIEIWRSKGTPGDTSAHTTLAMDDSRIYTVSDCGSAAATSRITGGVIWSRIVDPGHGCFEEDALVAGGVVYAGERYAYDAVTGAPRPSPPTVPTSVSPPFGFAGNGDELSAFRVDDNTPLWEAELEGSGDLEPLVVGGTVYKVSYNDFDELLTGYELSTGDALFRADLSYLGSDHYVAGVVPGLAAGAERLLVARDSGVTAFEPLLRPPATGVDVITDPRDVFAGSVVQAFAGLGPEVRSGGQDISVTFDEHPFGNPDRTEVQETDDDGVARLDAEIGLNTKVIVESPNGSTSETVVYAYPEYGVRAAAIDPQTIRMRVTVRRVAPSLLRGRKVVAYSGTRAGSTWHRRTARTLRVTEDGVGKASLTFRVPGGVKGSTRVAACGRGFPEDGLGRDVGLPGKCGAEKISVSPIARRQRSGAGMEPAGFEPATSTLPPTSTGSTVGSRTAR